MIIWLSLLSNVERQKLVLNISYSAFLYKMLHIVHGHINQFEYFKDIL